MTNGPRTSKHLVRRRGFVMVAAIIVIAISAAIVGAITCTALLSLHESKHSERQAQLMAACRAGLELALLRLEQSDATTSGEWRPPRLEVEPIVVTYTAERLPAAKQIRLRAVSRFEQPPSQAASLQQQQILERYLEVE